MAEAIIISMVFLFLLICILLGLVMYLFFSYSLYKIAQTNGIQNAWLAWIPIVQYYTLGELAKEQSKIKSLPGLLLGTQIGILFLSIWLQFFQYASLEAGDGLTLVFFFIIGLLFFVAYVAYFILIIYTSYLIFKMYDPKDAVLFTILNFVTGFIMLYVYMFIKRNKLPVYKQQQLEDTKETSM